MVTLLFEVQYLNNQPEKSIRKCLLLLLASFALSYKHKLNLQSIFNIT